MKKYKVCSQREAWKIYIISENDSGFMACSCPASQYRSGPCKHVESLKALPDEERAKLLLDPEDNERSAADKSHMKNMDKIRPNVQKDFACFYSLPEKPQGIEPSAAAALAKKAAGAAASTGTGIDDISTFTKKGPGE